MSVIQHGLDSVDAFKSLSDDHLRALQARLDIIKIVRGATLVEQGAPSDALFIVMSGRFEVRVRDRPMHTIEIGPGGPIGEIGFFAGGLRTASVIALRDSLVLKLDRRDFDAVVAERPGLWPHLAATLARRLAAETAHGTRRLDAAPRTIAMVAAGSTRLPDGFVERLHAAFRSRSRSIVVRYDDLCRELGADADIDGQSATTWLNSLEEKYDHVVFVTDGTHDAWSRKAVRQADEVLLVGSHHVDIAGSVALTGLERQVFETHAASRVRLALLHGARAVAVSGTRHWLAERPVRCHHHISLEDDADLARLQRFLTGRAVGLVACGGGSFCAIHIGLYKALRERGIAFDMIGGTSGGGAMAAAFALMATPETIDESLEDIFIRRRALRRWTWPRYAFMDHKILDAALAEHFTDVDIEDLWTSFFAVSTNLSRNELHVHRSGKLWEAVRATGAIPGLLPPFYAPSGDILVDGALLDNVPVATMHSLKSGPNVVISFSEPDLERYDVDYASLPSRAELLCSLLNPFRRNRLPAAPGPRAVLMRSLAAIRQGFDGITDDDNLIMMPPIPAGMHALDWSRHSELARSGYAYACRELDRLQGECHPLLSPDHRACIIGATPTSRSVTAALEPAP